jgi:hypothetical protein
MLKATHPARVSPLPRTTVPHGALHLPGEPVDWFGLSAVISRRNRRSVAMVADVADERTR